MISRLISVLIALSGWLVVGTSMAADVAPAMQVAAHSSTEVVTGLTNVAPAMLVIAVAGALLLTLVLRTSAGRIASLGVTALGKRRVQSTLRQKSREVLDDFILPGAYGGLTKIDHAILTSGGVICIQTKHYNGIVFGEQDEPQWTNVDGVQRRKFLNPTIQNEGRTKALRKVLPNVPVANLVVFTGNVQFSTPLGKNVIHVRELNSYINKFVFGPCRITDWDAVWLTLKAAALTDEETRKDLSAQLSFS